MPASYKRIFSGRYSCPFRDFPRKKRGLIVPSLRHALLRHRHRDQQIRVRLSVPLQEFSFRERLQELVRHYLTEPRGIFLSALIFKPVECSGNRAVTENSTALVKQVRQPRAVRAIYLPRIRKRFPALCAKRGFPVSAFHLQRHIHAVSADQSAGRFHRPVADGAAPRIDHISHKLKRRHKPP